MTPNSDRFRVALTMLLVCVAWSAASAQTFGSRSSSGQILVALFSGGVAEFDPSTGQRTGSIREPSLLTVAVGPFAHIYAGSFNINSGLTVKEFAPGNTRPVRVIQTNQELGNIAVSAHGELAVAGGGAGICCENLLLFYPYGQSSPSRSIAPRLKKIDYVAYDSKGNCWLDGGQPDPRRANRYIPLYGYVAPHSTTITVVPFEGSPKPGPLTVDPSGNIVIATGGGIAAFDPAGKLVSETPLQAMPSDITGIGFSADGATLFTSSEDTLLETYAYPAGGVPTHIFGWYARGLAIGGS